uniref:Epidermal patterning factor-like protein n=1 Tax=Oryza punctata TaxID=4537 RepID=A0A0E0K5F0_ORYPU
MAVRSPHQAFLVAMILVSFLLGAAAGIRSTTLSSSQNLAEDKSRLGSTPPSCHNRCNACNPCTPVQVAALPGVSLQASAADRVELAGFAQYSNYKPLGWKCRCAGRLFDP